MTQLVYKQNFKKCYCFSIVHHLESFPKCIVRYWWLTYERCFTVSSNDCYGFQCQDKSIWLQKFKNNENEVFKWQFYIFETDDEARNLFMKRQDM